MVTTLRLHECFFLQSLVIDNFLRAVNEENQVWAPKFKYYFNELRDLCQLSTLRHYVDHVTTTMIMMTVCLVILMIYI